MATHEGKERAAGQPTGLADPRPDSGSADEYRSSWTEGPRPHHRLDAYGQRFAGQHDTSGGRTLGTDAGGEHGPYEHEYWQWRDEQARAMDRDYASWRRERFSKNFAEWRAIRAAQAGLRTGSGPEVTHEDRERELRGPQWPERWRHNDER